jgi:hypothetical protein
VLRRLVVLVAGLALAAPGTAGAHLRTSRAAVDYRATVSQLGPPLAGAVAVRVYRADLALGLTALGGHRVVVLGYLGEPFLRLGSSGVSVNAASPTAAGARLTPPHRRSGHPVWRLRSRRPSVIWHDARVRGLPSGVTARRWAVPLLVDGRRTRLEGTIQRVDAPSAWPWLALGALFAAVTGALLALRPQQLLRTACAGLGAVAAAATLTSAIGFALASTASEGTWIEGANEAVFALVGAAFIVRGSRDAKAFAGGLLGLLGLAAGLTKLPVLLHGIVLSALPGELARLAVVLAIGAGAAAAILGVVVFFDVLEHYEEPELLERHLSGPEG